MFLSLCLIKIFVENQHIKSQGGALIRGPTPASPPPQSVMLVHIHYTEVCWGFTGSHHCAPPLLFLTYCLKCHFQSFWFPNLFQSLDVYHMDTLIGRVRERPNCCGRKNLEIWNKNEEKIFDITGPCMPEFICDNVSFTVFFSPQNDFESVLI